MSLEMENCKTFYETKKAIRLKECIQPSLNRDGGGHQINSNYIFQTNIFIQIYTEIYRYFFQSTSKMRFLGVKK